MIRNLIDRFFPNVNSLGHTITILGLPNSGKTTLLYLLKTGEIVKTVPTLGFNIETVNVKTESGKYLKMTGWDFGYGCCSSIQYGLIRTYTFSTKAIIWIVDASDRNSLAESVETLRKIISGVDQDRTDAIPILIFANKSDESEVMSLDEIRINFSKIISGRITSIFRTALAANTKPNELNQTTGLPKAFDWLLLALDIAKNANNPRPPPTAKVVTTSSETRSSMPDPRSSNTLSQKLQSWLTQTETDAPPEEFLEKFRSFTLPSWDHYTHIRIAYVILTKYGRKDGKEMIFEGIEKYITNSPQTTGKSFHLTMTYFWIQIVHFGIRNMPPPSQPPPNSDTTPPNPESGVTVDHTNASPEDFAKFLLVNPHVVDGNLWTDYYTKEVLMSPKAKAEMVLPDKQPLPNLVIRDTISSFTLTM